MEIDELSIRREDLAIVWVELRDTPVRRRFVFLDMAAPPAHGVLKLPPDRVKGVADGDVHVFMGVMLVGLTGRHELGFGYLEINTHVIQVALVMVLVMRLHHHPAAHDVFINEIELLAALANLGFHGLGRLHIAKDDL
jgi:hypothetical protein